MKLLLTITNLNSGNISIEVEQNFSDENVRKALRKLLGIDSDKFKCIQASTNGGIYGITEMFPSVHKKFLPVGFNHKKVFDEVEIVYSALIEHPFGQMV